MSAESSPKIVIVDESPIRAAILEEGLREAGFTGVVHISEMQSLLARIYALDPDVILIDLENPSRDVLEQMFQVSRAVRRPIAMFVDQSDAASIQASVEAGVSAYIVDGLKKERIKPILDLCISRFNAFSKLQDELDRTKSALEERKVIDRAKGILMKVKGLTEDEAYVLMRSTAMREKKEDRRDRAVDPDRVGVAEMTTPLHIGFIPPGRRRRADRCRRQGICSVRRARRHAGAGSVVVQRSRQAQHRHLRRGASAGAGGDRLQPRPRASQGADRGAVQSGPQRQRDHGIAGAARRDHGRDRGRRA
jgi:response regulator NasT